MIFHLNLMLLLALLCILSIKYAIRKSVFILYIMSQSLNAARSILKSFSYQRGAEALTKRQ